MRSIIVGFGLAVHFLGSASHRLRALPSRWLAAALLLAFASALWAPAVQAQTQFFSLVASVGQASTPVDVPVGPSPPEKVVDSSGFSIVLQFFTAVDIYGLMSYTVEGNFDPYFAARVRITNLKSSAQPITLFIRMPMQPVSTPPAPPFSSFNGSFTVTLIDSGGDLSASYTNGGPGFALTGTLGAGALLTPFHSVNLGAPGTVPVYDIASLPVPSSSSGQWSAMEFIHAAFPPTASSLSGADSVEFYVFGCVALPATSCPAPPPLPLPEPRAPAVFWAAVAGIAGVVCRRRNERCHCRRASAA